MALTSADENHLSEKSFFVLFEKKKAIWLKMAKEAYAYTKSTVPGQPKRDDVAPHLELALQTRKEFAVGKDERRSTARLWDRRFADLIVDRTWAELTGGNQ